MVPLLSQKVAVFANLGEGLPQKYIRKNANLMVKPLQNVIFWKVGYPNIFFQEICSTGGHQTIHNVSAASLSKPAILEHL